MTILPKVVTVSSEHWPHDYTLATCDSVNLQFRKTQTSVCTTAKTQMVPPTFTGKKQHTVSVFSIRVNNRSVILTRVAKEVWVKNSTYVVSKNP